MCDWLAPPEVDDDLLGFLAVQVVGFAPVHQMFHLLSVGRVVVLTDKGNYNCVIRKLHNVVSSGPGTECSLLCSLARI